MPAPLPKPKVKHLQEANATLRRLLKSEATITIKSIPRFADASLGNASGGSSQLAHMICAADESILEGCEAEVSLLAYTSHRMARAGSSTLLVEARHERGSG